MNSKKLLLLLIAPLAYFFLGSYIHQVIGLYSLRSADPEYIYFISGLSVANGKLMLGHIDNPGTPLQYLAALVFRGLYYLRNHQIPFNEDVLANADLYLRVLNLALTGVITAFIYWAGKAAFKITNSLSYSILLQLSPLFTNIIFGNIGRITPENLMPIPVMLLSLLILKMVFLPKEEQPQKQWIWFGLISAFGLSIKLTYFPLWIIPLILLETWKDRFRYSATAVAAFFAMALPVTLQINIFWGWIKGLFLHSGQYGKGDSNIVNWNTVLPNFNNLWNENRYFFWIILILGIVLALSFFLRKDQQNRLIQRISVAIFCAIFIQVAIVCKQFESRYFIPALMLFPISLLLIIETIKPINVAISKFRIPQVAVLLFVSIYFVNQVPVIRSLSSSLDQEKVKKMPALNYMSNLEKDAVKFLLPGGYGCPSPEYALMCSYGWAGKQKEFFKPVLAKLFPETYIYYPWDKTVNFWGNEPNIKETTKPVYIYLENNNLKDVFFADMKAYFPEKYELVRTFFNETTNEAVYKLVKVASE
ncbi:MAG: hypothetical protein WCI54_16705 [Bacteroidia bacterium]